MWIIDSIRYCCLCRWRTYISILNLWRQPILLINDVGVMEMTPFLRLIDEQLLNRKLQQEEFIQPYICLQSQHSHLLKVLVCLPALQQLYQVFLNNLGAPQLLHLVFQYLAHHPLQLLPLLPHFFSLLQRHLLHPCLFLVLLPLHLNQHHLGLPQCLYLVLLRRHHRLEPVPHPSLQPPQAAHFS